MLTPNGNAKFDGLRKNSIFPDVHTKEPMVYMIGIITFWLLFHVFSLLVLKFKRWDKR